MRKLKIVIIGGAGGIPSALRAFQDYLFPEWRMFDVSSRVEPEVTIVVTRFDKGGSSGHRSEGHLADLTTSCVTVGVDETLNEILHYRFDKEDVIPGNGHGVSFRKLFYFVHEKLGKGSGDPKELLNSAWARIDRLSHIEQEIFRYALKEPVFDKNDLTGDTMKNLLMVILQHTAARYGRTISETAKIFHAFCGGREEYHFFAVTEQRTTLSAKLANGETVYGENSIDCLGSRVDWNPHKFKIKELGFQPAITPTPEAVSALIGADVVIIAPGSVRTTTDAVLLALADWEKNKPPTETVFGRSKAKWIVIAPITTQRSEAPDATVEEVLGLIQKTTRRQWRKDDYVVMNTSPIPDKAKLRYSSDRKINLGKGVPDIQYLTGPLLRMDKETRTISHDPKALAVTLKRAFSNAGLIAGRVEQEPELPDVCQPTNVCVGPET